MATVTIILPKRAFEVLRRRAEFEDKTVEEFVSEVVLERLSMADPEVKVEFHLGLCEKYVREAEEFLTKGDYVQASEKAWGAASQMVKAIALKEGRELKSHAALWKYMDELSEKLADEELRRLWRTANALHQNFYENWMPSREVEHAVGDVKILLERLRKAV